jgi:hypothetical protein
MVGAAGLELAAFWSQTRRSSQLSYAPTSCKTTGVSYGKNWKIIVRTNRPLYLHHEMPCFGQFTLSGRQ